MGLLTRRADWPERLAEVVAQANDRPYVLGEWDCLRFSCAVIDAMTGHDYWPRFDGYKTKRQALVTIARIAPTLGEAVTKVIEQPPQSPLMAQRGDLVLYRDRVREDHLGIALGATVAVLGPAGLIHGALTDAGMRHCWRIG
jgi:cell wall-associated NlpC family hydrolase